LGYTCLTPLLRKLALHAVPLLLVARATVARAGEDQTGPPELETPEAGAPETEPPTGAPKPKKPPPAERERPNDHYYPPPVDGPALRLPESPNRLYADVSYAKSDDLTALPFIAGRGRNFRLALGGAWRWNQRFVFDAQVPLNLTTLIVTQILNGLPPLEADARQTKISLGDIGGGAVWTERLTGGEGLIGGLGLRVRIPTHTTRFPFHLMNGEIANFTIPYYFHLEPALILGGAFNGGSDFGRFTWVLNQGAIVLAGPDGNFYDQHISVPTLYMWEAHYAICWAPWSFLGTSVEVATIVQLNHVSSTATTNLEKFNDVRAVWVAPALQFHVGDARIDLIARIGASRGQEFYGVLEYVGTHSVTVRVTLMFD